MQDHKQLLASLHKHPGFKNWIKDVEENIPKLPLYNPQDHVHDNQAWAYWSGRLEGYKLLASYLGVKFDD